MKKITADSTQQSIAVGLEGRTAGGFAVRGASVSQTDYTPKVNRADSSSSLFGVEYVYVVTRNGQIQRADDLRAFYRDDNTFYNVVKDENGNAVKLPVGTYTLNFYKISRTNEMVIPTMIGVSSFKVIDTQLQ